jgi:hypothetical protein
MDFTNTMGENEMTEKRTSKDWQEELKEAVVVYDGDGWDRQNWHFSWEQELITKEEFLNRAVLSTCLYPNGVQEFLERVKDKE